MLQTKIKDLLRAEDKKHKELCDAIGISDAGMRKIYNRDSCELSTLRKIADFFGVAVTDLLEEKDVKIEIKDIDRSFNPGQNDPEAIQRLTGIIDEQRKRIDQLTDKLLEKK